MHGVVRSGEARVLFSNWRLVVKAIDVTRVKRTRDGSPVRVVCSDRISPEGNIIALVTQDDREIVLTYYANGRYWRDSDHPLDLVEEPETVEVERWINVYEDGNVIFFGTRQEADEWWLSGRIACVHIQRTVTKGDGLNAK